MKTNFLANEGQTLVVMKIWIAVARNLMFATIGGTIVGLALVGVSKVRPIKISGPIGACACKIDLQRARGERQIIPLKLAPGWCLVKHNDQPAEQEESVITSLSKERPDCDLRMARNQAVRGYFLFIAAAFFVLMARDIFRLKYQ